MKNSRAVVLNPHAKTSDLKKTAERWVKYGLPEKMNDKTFLDVGCWAGGFCVEAKLRGAERVLGIDMVKSPAVIHYSQKYEFDFLLCDIASEKYLEIPRFDIVFCAGVLYHVENVISLLFRLKLKVDKLLILETEITSDKDLQEIPLLRFYPGNDLAKNFSNWWVPNIKCVVEMLKACEFEDIKVVYQTKNRACFHAVPKNKLCKKILPRNHILMDT